MTEDAVSSSDDVTAVHSCAQVAPGVQAGIIQQALPSRHCLAQTLMQGTVGLYSAVQTAHGPSV